MIGRRRLLLVLAGLCASGVGCSYRPLPRELAAGIGGAGGSLTPPADPTDDWMIFPAWASDKLDLLLVIDNSQSMGGPQNKFLTNFPVFMNVLKALPAGLPDIHLGVISSDTGPGKYDLPASHCSFRGDGGQFQSQPRGACATSPLPAGQTFLRASPNQAEKNYAGDIVDAVSCLVALGTEGCGFQSPLEAIHWALDPNSMPAANRGFLRDDALLSVFVLTDGDDCSVPDGSDLFDPTQQHMSDPYGPFSSFRCNEFGHLCDVGGVLQRPARGPSMNLTGCVSDDNPTGKELSVAGEVAFLQGLKGDPRRVYVSVIAGPVVPYNVDMQSRRLDDGSVELQPVTQPSCQQNGTEFGYPAIRLQQWVEGFGQNGSLEPICADTFAPALTPIATGLSALPPPSCFPGQIPIDQASMRPACRVVERDLTQDGTRVDTVIPFCSDGAIVQPCWTLDDDFECPVGKLLNLSRSTLSPRPELAITCQPCPIGRSEIGCP